MPTLYLLQGSDKGHSFDINNTPVLLGRNSPDVPLTDNTVSRRHAELIRKKNGTWVIRDLNSANGTYVNGIKLSGFIELKPGDQIRCGATLIVFGNIPSGIMGEPGGLHIDENGNLVESSIMATVPTMDDSVIIAGPETSNAIGNLRLLYELSTAISTIFDRPQMLNKVMDIIFDNLPADRGFILLAEDNADKIDSKNLKPIVVRYRDKEQELKITVSHTIVEHAISNKEGVVCTNAMRDPRFASGESVQHYGIRSALCAPITVRNEIKGVIYVDTTMATHTYANEQLQLLTAIGYQTGMALEHARLYETGIQAERLAAAGETVAYISHGIKNILQSLQGAADMVEMGLKRNKVDLAQKGWGILQRNLTRVQNLVLNMLAFSKARQPHRTMVQLNRMITELIEMLSQQAQEKNVGLFTDLDDQLPAIAVDPDGIEQILLNLVLNALDAVESKTGAITIKTSFDAQAHLVVIGIHDNGKGIAPDQLKFIFHAFHSDKGQGGTGLGLAVVKKIAEEHSGRVLVESQPNEGTTFTILLPSDAEVTDSSMTAGPGGTRY